MRRLFTRLARRTEAPDDGSCPVCKKPLRTRPRSMPLPMGGRVLMRPMPDEYAAESRARYGTNHSQAEVIAALRAEMPRTRADEMEDLARRLEAIRRWERDHRRDTEG